MEEKEEKLDELIKEACKEYLELEDEPKRR